MPLAAVPASAGGRGRAAAAVQTAARRAGKALPISTAAGTTILSGLARTAGDAADQLLALLSSASLDGLTRQTIMSPQLQADDRRGARRQEESALPKPTARCPRRSSVMSPTWAGSGVGLTYVDANLKPAPPTPLATLLTAAIAPSLPDYVHNMGWMHPFYAELRDALATHAYSTDQQRDVLEINLQRARALPAGRSAMSSSTPPSSGCTCTKTARSRIRWSSSSASRNGRRRCLPPISATPRSTLIGMCHRTSPGRTLASSWSKFGLKYLDDYGYEIVSDWTPNPTIIDPKTVDWKGVVGGTVDIMIRQKPGPKNFMGRMKFMFPNQFGVYLHDNPRRELFLKSARSFSGGCVRLEDAARLGRWLFGHDLDWQVGGDGAAGAAGTAGAGLHHLSDGNTGRDVDRLLRRRLRARCAKACGRDHATRKQDASAKP